MKNSRIVYLSPIFLDTSFTCTSLVGENSVEEMVVSFGGVQKLIGMIKPSKLIWYAPFDNSFKIINNLELSLENVRNYKKSVIVQGNDTKTSFTEGWLIKLNLENINLQPSDILVISYAEDFIYDGLVECKADMVAIDFSGRYRDVIELKRVLGSFEKDRSLLISVTDHDKYLSHEILLSLMKEFTNIKVVYHDPKKIVYYSGNKFLSVVNEYLVETIARVGLGDYLLFRLIPMWVNSSISHDSLKAVQYDIYKLITES